MEQRKEYDVIIIGGGATGAGTARDCAMRGLSVLLLERFDYTSGATGRNHGLLHSGARYAVNDHESAAECIRENSILRRIARHCVDDTFGLFIALPEDDLTYRDKFMEGCAKAGIKAEELSPREALALEPAVNPLLTTAVKVPDGAIDPFRLTIANIIDAQAHGALTMTQHEVRAFVREQDRIVGVQAWNHRTGEQETYYGRMVVNACGIWGHHVAQLAGVTVNMFPAKGALLIFGHRVNNKIINRLRKPADADILVPGDTVCVLGTTSSRVPYEEIDHMQVTADEVDLLLSEGEKLAPSLATTRILRAYAGVRPLVASDDDPSGRSISRGIVLLDHETRDGLRGFATITGGKLMTYRLMAEQATDLICQKLGVSQPCRTAEVPLPGSRDSDRNRKGKMAPMIEETAMRRFGELSEEIPAHTKYDNSLICECECVTVGEARYAIEKRGADSLIALRRNVRLGMGTCQGGLCACRGAGLLCERSADCEKARQDLAQFMNERWKGMYPVLWGDCIRESQYAGWVYNNVCGLSDYNGEE